MAVYFFDSSAIVKRYVSETGTAWVSGIIVPAAGNRIYVAAIARLRLDFASEYRIVEITPALIGRAMMLAERHALRGYDAVQVAAALETHVQASRVADECPNVRVC